MMTADYRHRVEQLVTSGRPFCDIEGVIDAAPLRNDQKAALWLLAWSYQEPELQRRMARETLAALA
jgi:hypothetical protein